MIDTAPWYGNGKSETTLGGVSYFLKIKFLATVFVLFEPLNFTN